MQDVGSWRRYTDGGQDSVVVAIDFPITGRNEAGFAELAPLLGDGFSLWETLPPMVTDPTEVSGVDYVDTWLADLRESGRRVDAIFSFCAGAAFIPALARGLREWQDEAPKVILFDPEIPVPLTLHVQFRRALERFAPLLTAEEREGVFATADRIYAENSEDITALQAAITEVFHRIAHTGFERAGLDPRHGAELLSAFDSFACYLVAGARSRAAVTESETAEKPIAISSHTPTNGLNLVPEEERAALVAKEIRFDIAHAVLLSSDEVARTVAELLG